MVSPRTRVGGGRGWRIAIGKMGQGRQGCLYVVNENETRYQEVTSSVEEDILISLPMYLTSRSMWDKLSAPPPHAAVCVLNSMVPGGGIEPPWPVKASGF